MRVVEGDGAGHRLFEEEDGAAQAVEAGRGGEAVEEGGDRAGSGYCSLPSSVTW